MIDYGYKLAFSEVMDILNHTKKVDVDRIPKKLLIFMQKNSLKSYKSRLDFTKPLREMRLSSKAVGILSVINKQYWCNLEEKKLFEEKLKQNEMNYQKNGII